MGFNLIFKNLSSYRPNKHGILMSQIIKWQVIILIVTYSRTTNLISKFFKKNNFEALLLWLSTSKFSKKFTNEYLQKFEVENIEVKIKNWNNVHSLKSNLKSNSRFSILNSWRYCGSCRWRSWRCYRNRSLPVDCRVAPCRDRDDFLPASTTLTSTNGHWSAGNRIKSQISQFTIENPHLWLKTVRMKTVSKKVSKQ